MLQHVLHKCACAKCDHDDYNPQFDIAKKLPQPTDRGLPGPSLFVYVVTSRLGDHLPLYRLENIFSRQHVHVARSTMYTWMLAARELVTPLAPRVKESRVDPHRRPPAPIQSPSEKTVPPEAHLVLSGRRVAVRFNR